MSAKTIGETLAALGVIASLVFVGLEIRQNTAVARAQTRQALTEDLREFIMTLAADETLFEVYHNRFDTGYESQAGDEKGAR